MRAILGMGEIVPSDFHISNINMGSVPSLPCILDSSKAYSL